MAAARRMCGEVLLASLTSQISIRSRMSRSRIGGLP
jgi:hypothetical protein